jgi:phosphatidylethanolamine-binding protein (PEBP) family uncharacterized protein
VPSPTSPARGSQHTYEFTLYAIDSASLGLTANVSVNQVDTAARAAMLASTTLSGTYTP